MLVFYFKFKPKDSKFGLELSSNTFYKKKENKMTRKQFWLGVLATALIFVTQGVLFAGGNRESPTKNNVYTSLGPSIFTETETSFFNWSVGYEGAIGSSFALGANLGLLVSGDVGFGVEFLLKPRFYFGSSLEKFFLGGNLGYYSISTYYSNTVYDPPYGYPSIDSGYTDEGGFVAGVNAGYKFVFGSRSAGFSLEPSIGYDFIPSRINIGLALGFAFGGNARQEPAPRPVPVAAPSSVRDGIYVGIIVFGPDSEDITGGNPVYLDQQGQGMATLNNLLETRYQRTTSIGTALFYSAHLALANMKAAESKIPRRDLASVTLFTFTDGLDVSSTGLSLPTINDPGNVGRPDFAGGPIKPYMDFVKGEIDNRKINGTSITGRIVAVQGDDITDITAFRSALRSLATGERYVRDDINMARLNDVFQETANGIVNAWTQTSFTMITPEYAAGTRVRMVFGGGNAQNARFYIDGEVTVRNRQYYLTNISYGGGISSSVPQGGEIRGKMGGNRVEYLFPQITGENQGNSGPSQWLITPGSNVWQINSEYNSAGASQRNVEKHNALIYLVLDRSSSIASADVPRVQQAAKNFIRILHDVYWQN
jgi:hypothetical protein